MGVGVSQTGHSIRLPAGQRSGWHDASSAKGARMVTEDNCPQHTPVWSMVMGAFTLGNTVLLA
jgi:hypothetical protein